MRFSALVIIGCLTIGQVSVELARAEVTVADTGAFVIDQAALLDAGTRQKIEGWFRELEQKTSDQVKLLTVKSTDGENIDDFAQRHFDLWKLGQKGKDNGALLVLALQERQFRIRTGYGMEGAMPDSWCGTLFRQLGQPRFREGKFAQGLYEIAVAVANKAADEAGVQLTGVPDLRVRDEPEMSDGWKIVLLIFILILIWSWWRTRSQRGRSRYRGSGWPGPWIGPGSFGGGFGGFGGGSGGGSFGGGGGFGGSFGGGGRSGGGGGGGGW